MDPLSLDVICLNDPDHPPIKVGEVSGKIALVRPDDDEGLENEYTVSDGWPS